MDKRYWAKKNPLQLETFGGDGYVYCIDCDGFTNEYLPPNSSSCIHQICTAYLNKVVKKKKRILSKSCTMSMNVKEEEVGRQNSSFSQTSSTPNQEDS